MSREDAEHEHFKSEMALYLTGRADEETRERIERGLEVEGSRENWFLDVMELGGLDGCGSLLPLGRGGAIDFRRWENRFAHRRSWVTAGYDDRPDVGRERAPRIDLRSPGPAFTMAASVLFLMGGLVLYRATTLERTPTGRDPEADGSISTIEARGVGAPDSGNPARARAQRESRDARPSVAHGDDPAGKSPAGDPRAAREFLSGARDFLDPLLADCIRIRNPCKQIGFMINLYNFISNNTDNFLDETFGHIRTLVHKAPEGEPKTRLMNLMSSLADARRAIVNVALRRLPHPKDGSARGLSGDLVLVSYHGEVAENLKLDGECSLSPFGLGEDAIRRRRMVSTFLRDRERARLVVTFYYVPGDSKELKIQEWDDELVFRAAIASHGASLDLVPDERYSSRAGRGQTKKRVGEIEALIENVGGKLRVLWGGERTRISPLHASLALGGALLDFEADLGVNERDSTVHIWDLADPTADPVLLVGHDGTSHIAGPDRRDARPLGTAEARPRGRESVGSITPGIREDEITDACFSADSRRVITVDRGRAGQVWDTGRTEGLTDVLSDLRRTTRAACFGSDGRLIFAAGDDEAAQRQDAEQTARPPIPSRTDGRRLDAGRPGLDDDRIFATEQGGSAQFWLTRGWNFSRLAVRSLFN